MPKIILNAGHTKGRDEGAHNLQTKETENQIARNLLLRVFRYFRDKIPFELCPFHLSLKEQIQWINQTAQKNVLILSCHLDSTTSRRETGTMCYYYGGSQKSKKFAQKILDTYAQATGLKNRGIQPDTASRFGRLGIIRDTPGWAFLLELGSINNDLKVIQQKSQTALIQSILALWEEWQ